MTYRDQVIADGATNYWRLDEMTGTVAKDIINGATGTISGGVTLGQPGALTDGNTAITFDGTTGKIVTAAAVTIAVSATVEAWVNPTKISSNPVVTLGSVQTPTFYLNAQQLGAFNPGSGTATGLVLISTGVWHHVVYVVDGTTVRFYVDGVLDRAAAFVRATPATGVANLGGDPAFGAGAAAFWQGSLDDVAIYPVVLTAAQIAAHYAAGRAVPRLVTLDQVKRRLRITSTADDVDLQDLTDQAVAKIVNWCSTTPRAKAIADGWDAVTVPPVVVAAILVQAGEFYRFRGDDTDSPPRQNPEELPVLVRELLRAYHDPGIA